MHRNTFFLVIILAIFAALVLGFNAGKNWQKTPAKAEPTPIPTMQISTVTNYQNSFCGVTLDYPKELTILEATAGAIFNNPIEASQSVIIACQKQIPRPPLPANKIETFNIGTVSAKLYHDSSLKDGAAIDELIFTHPTNGMDIFVAGLGATFEKIIKTIEIK